MQLHPIKQLLIFAELQVIHGAHTKWKQIAMVKESVLLWLRFHAKCHAPSVVSVVWNNGAIVIEAYGAQPLFAVLRPEHLKVRWPVHEVA